MLGSSREQRSALIGLASLAAVNLAKVWDQIAGSPDMGEAIEELTSPFSLAAGTLAADWYLDTREAAGIGGLFTAAPAAGPSSGLFRWIAEVAVEGDPDTALVRTEGSVQKVVANAHRDTITELSAIDPKASGWRRVGQGENCDFCNMLIARGAIYKSGRSSRFASHQHCNCLAEPAFQEGPAAPALPYSRSPRAVSDQWKAANAKRVREYIAQQNN